MQGSNSTSKKLIVSTDLKNLRQLHTDVDRGAALERHKQISSVGVSKGLEIYFAEPVYNSGGDQIDWFTSLEGGIRGFNSLDKSEVNHVKFEIKNAVEKIDLLTEELRSGDKSSLANAIEGSLEIPSLESVFLVGDKVVLCDWGFVKDTFKSQKGILRKISGDSSEAILSVNVVGNSSENLENALVSVSSIDRTERTNENGFALFGGLIVGNTIEVIVEVSNYTPQTLSLTIDSPEVNKVVVFTDDMSLASPDVSYDNLFVSNNKGNALPNKNIKLTQDQNRKAYKSDSDGLIQFEKYNVGTVVQAKADIFHSIEPRHLPIEEGKDRYSVVLKKRWWLLLFPLLLLLLSFFFYQKNTNILLPILTIYINGQGEVLSDSGFACTSGEKECSSPIGLGEINLKAKPYKGYVFKEWKESCSGSNEGCSFTIGAFNKRVIAVFEPDMFTLTVKADQRHGSITSSIPTADALICGSNGSDCEHEYRYGEDVDLNIREAQDYVFDRWEGDCSDSKNRRCKVTIETHSSVQAIFRRADARLSVAVLGDGVVDISTNLSKGDSCERDTSPCSFTRKFERSLNAQLKAIEKPGYKFVRWEGVPCNSGSKTCNFKLPEKSSVVAVFERNDIMLDVKLVSGEGSIISDNRNINCPSKCSHEYVYGQKVSLRPVPPFKSVSGDNYIFDHWGGDCSGTGACSVVLNSAKTVQAHFRKLIQCSPSTITRSSSDKEKSYVRVMNMGDKNNDREFTYSFYAGDKYHDELSFSYEGQEFYNTGCMINEQNNRVKYPQGRSKNITIEVRGACKPGQTESKTHTGWELVVNCPEG